MKEEIQNTDVRKRRVRERIDPSSIQQANEILLKLYTNRFEKHFIDSFTFGNLNDQDLETLGADKNVVAINDLDSRINFFNQYKQYPKLLHQQIKLACETNTSKVLVLLGPQGSGKRTVLKRAIQGIPSLVYIDFDACFGSSPIALLNKIKRTLVTSCDLKGSSGKRYHDIAKQLKQTWNDMTSLLRLATKMNKSIVLHINSFERLVAESDSIVYQLVNLSHDPDIRFQLVCCSTLIDLRSLLKPPKVVEKMKRKRRQKAIEFAAYSRLESRFQDATFVNFYMAPSRFAIYTTLLTWLTLDSVPSEALTQYDAFQYAVKSYLLHSLSTLDDMLMFPTMTLLKASCQTLFFSFLTHGHLNSVSLISTPAQELEARFSMLTLTEKTLLFVIAVIKASLPSIIQGLNSMFTGTMNATQSLDQKFIDSSLTFNMSTQQADILPLLSNLIRKGWIRQYREDGVTFYQLDGFHKSHLAQLLSSFSLPTLLTQYFLHHLDDDLC